VDFSDSSNNDATHTSAFPRHHAPEFCKIIRPQKIEGAGKTGCTLHPRSRVQTAQKNAHEHTGSAETLRPSPRNGFTTYIALSLATGLSCHHHRRDTSRQLDASVGASGPHDFAVRVGAVRQERRCVHRIPPHVRDDREPPLSSGETGEVIALICPTAKATYFSREGWTAKSSSATLICPSGNRVSKINERTVIVIPNCVRHCIEPQTRPSIRSCAGLLSDCVRLHIRVCAICPQRRDVRSGFGCWRDYDLS
jgi:hypothetical protein